MVNAEEVKREGLMQNMATSHDTLHTDRSLAPGRFTSFVSEFIKSCVCGNPFLLERNTVLPNA